MDFGYLERRISERLSIWFRWTNLRSLGNSYWTRGAILIPLVGYLLLFNGRILEWLDVVPELGGSGTHNGVSTRLLWVYFGLCFIAFGNALYGVFCPQEIKDYPSANSYIVGDGDSIQTTALDAIKARLKNSGFEFRLKRLDDIYSSIGGSRQHQKKNDTLRLHFDYLNIRHRSMRITSAVAYIIGFCCLGVSSLQVFLNGVRVLFRNLVS